MHIACARVRLLSLGSASNGIASLTFRFVSRAITSRFSYHLGHLCVCAFLCAYFVCMCTCRGGGGHDGCPACRPTINSASNKDAIRRWFHDWLAGTGGIAEHLFGPRLGPPLLSSIGEVKLFVTANATAAPWRAKVVYVASETDFAYGTPQFLAAAWRHGNVADFGVLSPDGSEEQDPGMLKQGRSERKTFYTLHSIVAAPAMVVLWPANGGESSSGTLNSHSHSAAAIAKLMTKIEETSARKMAGKGKKKQTFTEFSSKDKVR
jgi:hypothetical protein